MEVIDPSRLYCLTEAAVLIPSCRAGKRTHRSTLYVKCKGGLLPSIRRWSGKRWSYFIWGHDLERFLGEPVPLTVYLPRSPARRQREVEAAEKEIAERYARHRKQPRPERRRGGAVHSN